MRIAGAAMVALAVVAGAPARARAQHEHHQQHQQHQQHEHQEHQQSPPSHQHHQPAAAQSALDLDAARNASGTAWQPELTPHAAFHASPGGWELMFHTLLFAGYDYQASDRGARAPVGIGWVMAMARRRLGSGALGARVMLSPEPWTAQQDGGYPLLLQTGETHRGQPLHDRQHPHDLFMEVALTYTQALGDAVALQLYAAPAGEPALGPVAFPHRQSAASDPLAALSHHWQDSTHISFGVLTAGVLTRLFKLEASWFNGREPDETRWDFDLRRPDSLAVRASLAPAPAWSAQASYGYLPDHDPRHPGEPLHRVTTSAMYHRPLAGGHWASTAVVGVNKDGDSPLTPAFLVESNLDLDGRNVVFGRLEVVQKTGEDLALPPVELEHETFLLPSVAAGYLRNLPTLGGLVPGVGVRAAVARISSTLGGYYGTRTLFGGIAYFRLAVAARAGH